MKTDRPQIKELSERWVAFISYTGNYIGNPQIFEDLFKRLGAWAGVKGLITPRSVFLSAYYDDPNITPPDELKLDACMSIPEEVHVDEDVQKKLLPGGKYAVMHCELANPEDFETAWNQVVGWAEENNCRIDLLRPSYEIYLNNPEEHPDKLHLINICLSVKST